MNRYFCWITVLLDSYQDKIITSLVKSGYMIRALNREGALIAPGKNASALIAFDIYHQSNKNLEKDNLYNDLVNALAEEDILYYSLIICDAADCLWYGANFDLKNKSNQIKTMN